MSVTNEDTKHFGTKPAHPLVMEAEQGTSFAEDEIRRLAAENAELKKQIQELRGWYHDARDLVDNLTEELETTKTQRSNWRAEARMHAADRDKAEKSGDEYAAMFHKELCRANEAERKLTSLQVVYRISEEVMKERAAAEYAAGWRECLRAVAVGCNIEYFNEAIGGSYARGIERVARTAEAVLRKDP